MTTIEVGWKYRHRITIHPFFQPNAATFGCGSERLDRFRVLVFNGLFTSLHAKRKDETDRSPPDPHPRACEAVS